jgi:hypothetical protein
MPDPVGLIPYGQRADGSYGFLLSAGGDPLVSVCEVLSAVPLVSDPNNFEGRLVFSTSAKNIYIFSTSPDEWVSLQAEPVTVAAPDPVGSGALGELYYATGSKLLFIWDGTRWVAIAGERGAQVIWRHYTTDGVTNQYATGASTLPPVDYVQVFLGDASNNLVALQPGSAGVRDYYMVGNNVQLNSTPTAAKKLSIRTLTFINFARNSSLLTSRYVANGSTNQFGTGILQSSAGQTFVFMDGVLQQPDIGAGAGTYDYRIVTQNLSVTSITAVGTTATMTTAAAHNLVPGGTVTVTGALQPEYNGTFTVNTAPTSTTLTYTMSSAPASSPATPSPAITFGPATFNDYVSFVNSSGVDTAPPSGAIIQIRAVENIVVGAVEGEVNTGQNLGTGHGVFAQKSGVTLQFKSIKAGSRVSLSSSSTEVNISAIDNIKTYTVYTGSPSTYVVTTNDHYIGARNSSGSPISIDLSAVGASGADTGRHIIIKDEARNANTHNISILPGVGHRINGGALAAALVLNTAGASVELVFDGNDWQTIGSTTS